MSQTDTAQLTLDTVHLMDAMGSVPGDLCLVGALLTLHQANQSSRSCPTLSELLKASGGTSQVPNWVGSMYKEKVHLLLS